MASIGYELRIKYGLREDPSSSQAQEWARLTKENIRKEMDKEAAGHAAAKYLFPDYRTHFYASEADTIETLLRLAGEK